LIRTLLIANRGEVAGRIASTCRKLGIRTVAVFSEADRHSPHIQMADEGILIGPAPASESYLNIEAVLEAARRSGADALHPGYGFLAENADFARRVEEAGLTFVGPHPDVIAKMGSKVEARKICEAADVPTIPGSGALDDKGLLKWAEEHGFPVMLKASAGGGGKGMRRLLDEKELKEAIPSARREAEKAFGCDELYLERALVNARHLEVQLVGDHHENLLHLGVRECPPVNISSELLESLWSSAVKLGEAVNYTSLGTVEFLVEGDNHYFLEMNTRLQVEHPVTEMVTGLDLVSLQLDVAQGLVLPFKQEQVSFRGHAVEARILCEDPYNNFLPCTGTVLEWRPSQRVRYDSVLKAGLEVSPHYDSMVAKIISWGEDRPRALRTLDAALSRTTFLGVTHNMDFLRFLLSHPEVEKGRQHTSLVESLNLEQPPPTTYQLLAATAYRALSSSRSGVVLNSLPVEFQFEDHSPVSVQGSTFELGENRHTVSVEGEWLEINGHRFPVAAARNEDDWWVHTPDGTVKFKAVPRLPLPASAKNQGGSLKAPMPGCIVEVLVKEGDEVEAGQVLITMEAMKMEQVISSPHGGTVKKVLYSPGAQVEAGAKLVEMEE